MERKYMIKKDEEFKRAHRIGKSFRNRKYILNVCPNDKNHVRFGFILTKKVGKATVRNKIKRQMKALLSQYKEEIKPGYDLIFVVKPSAANLTFKEIEKNVCHILKVSNVLKEGDKHVNKTNAGSN